MSRHDFDDSIRADHNEKLVRKFEKMIHRNTSVFIDQPGFDQIIDYYEDRFEYAKALQASIIAIEQHPFSASFRLRQGQLKFDANQYEEALDSVQKAKMLDANNTEIFLLESEILCELNRTTEALEVLNNLLEFVDSESLPEIYLAIADVYEKIDKPDLEMQYVKMSLVMNPDYEIGLERIMDLLKDQDQYHDAIDFHEKLINESPYSYLAWSNLGNCYFEVEEFEKAIDALSYVLAIKEDFEPAIRQTAESYYELDLFEKAIEYYRVCNDLKEEDEYLLYSIGLSYYQLENYDRASYHLNKCLELDADFSDGHYYLGKIFEKRGSLQRAESYIETAFKLEEDNEDYVQSLCELKFKLEKNDEGLKYQRTLTELDPENKNHWLDLIDRYITFNMATEAYTTGELSLDNFPDDGEMLFVLAVCAVLVGRNKEAMDWAMRSSSVDSTAFQVLKKLDDSLLSNPDIKPIIAPFVN